MVKQLGLGQYCGRSIRRRQVHGFVVTENKFAPGLEIGRHVHDHSHFTYILNGGFTEQYDNKTLECETAATLFVPANEPHTDRIWPSGAHSMGIEISPSVAGRVDRYSSILQDARVVCDMLLQHAARRLYREFHSNDSAAPLSIESLALEILVLTTRRKRGLPKQIDSNWLEAVHDRLHDCYRFPLSLKELAAEVGVHETHLARAFRSRYGCTVGEYVRHLRLEASAAELKRSEKTIAEIAADAGFYDQAHFCRTFRRAFGVSPSGYRQSR